MYTAWSGIRHCGCYAEAGIAAKCINRKYKLQAQDIILPIVNRPAPGRG